MLLHRKSLCISNALESRSVSVLPAVIVAALGVLCVCLAFYQLEREGYTHKQNLRARTQHSFVTT